MQRHNREIHTKTPVEKRVLTEREAAEYIGMSQAFLRQDRMNGPRHRRTLGPPYIRIGRRSIRYLLEDLDGWLEGFREPQNGSLHR